MPSNCALNNSGQYAVKHNPAAYFDAGTDRQACQQDNLPMGSASSGNLINALASDSSLPTFSFITPNLCNDVHSCGTTTGDNWLKALMPKIIASPAYQSGDTMVAVWFDEDTPIPNIVMSKSAKHVVLNDASYSHYSLLRTTEDLLGITTHLGKAASAPSFAAAYNLTGTGGGGGSTPTPTSTPPPTSTSTPPPTQGGSSTPCSTTTTPATTYGVVTQTVNVPTAGVYRVWSRVKAASSSANSYYFTTDSHCYYNIGDSTNLPANTWQWVDYKDGSTSAVVNVSLTAGTHTFKYIGREANVQLDRILLLGDLSCVPTGVGDTPSCVNSDTQNPSVSITSPT